MWIVLLILLLLCIGGLPQWPHAHGWGVGYGPSSVLGIILIVVLVLFLLGRFR